MSQAINDYINWKATYTKRAPSEYRRILDRFLDVTHKDIETLELSDIVHFRSVLKEKHRLSDNSIAQSLTVIKNFIRFWREQGIGKIQPSHIRVPKDFSVNSHTPLEKKDFDLMCSSLNRHNIFHLQKLVAIHLLWHTGIRVSELCELNVAQMNGGRAFIKNKKNNGSRWIFWPKDTQTLIEEFIRIRLSFSNHPALIIPLQNPTKRMTTRSVERWIKDISENIKLGKKISPHSFRHGWSHFRRETSSPFFLKTGLGHKSMASTEIYNQFTEVELEKEAKKHF